jgi:SAM-dependent methyltransferase
MRFSTTKDRTISNTQFGYQTLDPIPTEEELNIFYTQKYYEQMKNNDAQSLDRFINEDKNQINEELSWLQSTEYEDANILFSQYFPNGKLLDIGCGTGEMIKYMKEIGYDTYGIEPSTIACEKAKAKDLNIFNCDLFNFPLNNQKFDIINMTNVLEHITEPIKVIEKCKNMLNKNGILRIKVPNDFNEFQLEIVNKLNKDEYWIAVPDHVNYFNFESLTNVLNYEGFEVIHKMADFPMELFLLMGDDYITDSKLGKACHQKRQKLERNLSNGLRRKLYSAFSNIGLGRNLIIYCILK